MRLSQDRRAVIWLARAAAVSAVLLATTSACADDLIPRQALFGAPAQTSAMISPDGRQLAFVAPRDGTPNLWIAPVNAISQARPITRETARPIGAFQWAPDSRQLLYLQDASGDENDQLYGVDLATGQVRAYTGDPASGVRIVKVSSRTPGEILISINDRDKQWRDVYRLDLKTGIRRRIFTNPGGYGDVVADADLDLLATTRIADDGSFSVVRFASGRLQPVGAPIGVEDATTTALLSAADGAGQVYMIDSRGRDTAAISRLDLATGAVRTLAADSQVDLGLNANGDPDDQALMLHDPRTGRILAYVLNRRIDRWRPLAASVRLDLARLDRRLGPKWYVTSQTDDGTVWVVCAESATQPPQYYLYRRADRSLSRLFDTRPGLSSARLAQMRPVEIPSRDGRRLSAYLTLPRGVEIDGSGRPRRPLPMVMWIHGGPDERDHYGYNSHHQWLADRGYAVLSVNYRGSTGFGKAFANARAWSPEVEADLLDAADWAKRTGLAQPDRIAIAGGSYGGYAVLATLSQHPRAWACGIDLYGPVDLPDLMRAFPADWKPLYERLVRRLGDPRTPAGLAYLEARSPARRLDQIEKPLLVAQGANDPRVHKAQSDQVVASLSARGAPVTYLVFADEGHGLVRPQNAMAFAAVAESFLSKCLGGRAESIGDDLTGSSLSVVTGAALVPGLRDRP